MGLEAFFKKMTEALEKSDAAPPTPFTAYINGILSKLNDKHSLVEKFVLFLKVRVIPRVAQFEKDCGAYTSFSRLYIATGIPPATIPSIFLIACILSAIKFFQKSSHFFTTLVGTAYPSYYTLKALHHDDNTEKRRWATYCNEFLLIG